VAGPFERLGPEAFLALGSSLVGVSTLDVMVGMCLWHGQRRRLRLALATDLYAPRCTRPELQAQL